MSRFSVKYKVREGDTYENLLQRFGSTLANAGIYGDEDLVNNKEFNLGVNTREEAELLLKKDLEYQRNINKGIRLRNAKSFDTFWELNGNDIMALYGRDLTPEYATKFKDRLRKEYVSGSNSILKLHDKAALIQKEFWDGTFSNATAKQDMVHNAKEIQKNPTGANLRTVGYDNSGLQVRNQAQVEKELGRKLTDLERQHLGLHAEDYLNFVKLGKGKTYLDYLNYLEGEHKSAESTKDLTRNIATGITLGAAGLGAGSHLGVLAGSGSSGTGIREGVLQAKKFLLDPTISASLKAMTTGKYLGNLAWNGLRGMITHPLQTAGDMAVSTATDMGLRELGVNEYAAMPISMLTGSMANFGVDKALRSYATRKVGPQKLMKDGAEKWLTRTWGNNASEKVNALHALADWGTGTIIGEGSAAISNNFINPEENPLLYSIVNTGSGVLLGQGLNRGVFKNALLNANGGDNAASILEHNIASLKAQAGSIGDKFKMPSLRKKMSEGDQQIFDLYMNARKLGMSKDESRKMFLSKLANPENSEAIEKMGENAFISSQKFTALYGSNQDLGLANGYGAGTPNQKRLSTSEKLGGYTTEQFGNPQSDAAKTYVGTIREGKQTLQDGSADALLADFAGVAGIKRKGHGDVYTYTQKKDLYDEMAGNADQLYSFGGFDETGQPIIHPFMRDGQVNREGVKLIGVRSQDPKVGLKDSRGRDLRENWDGSNMTILFSKGADGKYKPAYTMGLDVAGGATMASHGNSGFLAPLVDSFNDNNVISLDVHKGIANPNIFANTTWAGSSNFDIFEEKGLPGLLGFGKRANRRNIANRENNARNAATAQLKELLHRAKMAELYNKFLKDNDVDFLFNVPQSTKGLNVDTKVGDAKFEKNVSEKSLEVIAKAIKSGSILPNEAVLPIGLSPKKTSKMWNSFFKEKQEDLHLYPLEFIAEMSKHLDKKNLKKFGNLDIEKKRAALQAMRNSINFENLAANGL